jgi:hypothetical protein
VYQTGLKPVGTSAGGEKKKREKKKIIERGENLEHFPTLFSFLLKIITISANRQESKISQL